jgi:hypothetical protein
VFHEFSELFHKKNASPWQGSTLDERMRVDEMNEMDGEVMDDVDGVDGWMWRTDIVDVVEGN